MKTVNIPRIVIGATGSGTGKTMITCGLIKAFLNRNLQTASFKCGPDYIDPMFHSRVLGTRSRNLDSFFTVEKVTKYLFSKTAEGMDISVIEGVMGYYDGLGGVSMKASTYEMAGVTKSPSILILNGNGMSVSILAIIKGFLEYQPESGIKGVILNHMSPMFYKTIKHLIEEQFPIQVFGYVPKIEEIKIASRHLGLISPDEVKDFQHQIQKLSEVLEETIDIDAILKAARQAPDLEIEPPIIPCIEKKLRLGIAKDPAFSFHYEDNLELLSQMGGEICYFSPLYDKELPKGIQGIWLGGGYPEHYAKELSKNITMRKSIQQAIAGGMPCIAECGGFMYLHRELENESKEAYPMVGIIPARAYRTERLQRFGYLKLEANKDSLFGKKGIQFPAHEFHYWDSEMPGVDYMAVKPLKNRSYTCIHATEYLWAGFPHIYLYANPECAFQYLKACENYQVRC